MNRHMCRMMMLASAAKMLKSRFENTIGKDIEHQQRLQTAVIKSQLRLEASSNRLANCMRAHNL